ncbi:MAG: TetR/AcrR family transcriptional regulator [Thermoleophilaceae bacterium]
MAARPARPVLGARYDRRRAEVVDGAAKTFARSGYDQTSVPELAESLGLATGSLYHYFGSKEQLLIAICDELMDPLLAETEQLVERDMAPDEQLRELVRLWVAHVIGHRDHMLAFQQERHVIDHGDRWRHVRESRKRFERIVERVLERACDAGLTIELDRRLLLSALLGMVNHTAQWHRPSGRLGAVDIADGYVDLLLHTRRRA